MIVAGNANVKSCVHQRIGQLVRCTEQRISRRLGSGKGCLHIAQSEIRTAYVRFHVFIVIREIISAAARRILCGTDIGGMSHDISDTENTDFHRFLRFSREAFVRTAVSLF